MKRKNSEPKIEKVKEGSKDVQKVSNCRGGTSEHAPCS